MVGGRGDTPRGRYGVRVRPGRAEFSRSVLSFVAAYALTFVTVRLASLDPGWFTLLMWVLFGVAMYVLTRRSVRRGAVIRIGASALAAFIVTVVVTIGWGIWAVIELRSIAGESVHVSGVGRLWLILVGIEPFIMGAFFALGAYLATRLGARRTEPALIT
jgi:hypothetical protein